MTIKVVCQCGATFGAKDELAGRTVACPKCKQPLKIGAPSARAPAPVASGISDLLDEAGFDRAQGPRCPQCSKPMQPGGLLCVNCGFNLQTGEKVVGAVIQVKGEGGDKAVAKSLLTSAADRIANEKLEDKKTRSQGAPIWVYLVAFAGVLAFVACMLLIPRDRAFRINGIGLMVFGYIIMTIYGIRMIVAAFMEDVMCGVLWLFVPFYSLYYLVTRWSRMGSLFTMQLLGLVFVGVGMGMVAISPYMAIKDKSEVVHVQQPGPAAVPAAVEHAEFDRLPVIRARTADRTTGTVT